eukprot:372593-Pleurochrysis_carterae.AAC.3
MMCLYNGSKSADQSGKHAARYHLGRAGADSAQFVSHRLPRGGAAQTGERRAGQNTEQASSCVGNLTGAQDPSRANALTAIISTIRF